jgi:hypothetical protein
MSLSQLERPDNDQVQPAATLQQPLHLGPPPERADERAGRRERSSAAAILGYVLVLLPMLAFYCHFLLTYQHTYFLRRDENIMLAIFAQVRSGSSLSDIFTMIITPGFVAVVLWMSRAIDVLLLGRALCMISAVSCAILAAVIARKLFRSSQHVPLIALALMASSALFVQEGTIFRLNLMSLALSLASVVLLFDITWSKPARALGKILISGLLLGLALEVKALALAVAPFIAYLLWQAAYTRSPELRRRSRYLLVATPYVLGCLLPMLLAAVLTGAEGSRLDTQLSRHLEAAGGTSLILRLTHTVAMFWGFVTNHVWLILFFVLSAARTIGRSGARAQLTPAEPAQHTSQDDARAMTMLVIWAATIALVLLVNFPSWDHHYVYLLPPLAIGAAFFLEGAGALLFDRAANSLKYGRRAQYLLAPLTVVYVGVAAIGTFAAASALSQQGLTADVVAVSRMVEARTTTGDTVWSDNMVFPLLTKRTTDPQLVDLSVKRIISGQLSEDTLFNLFTQRPPRAVIVYDGLFDAFPNFVRCVSNVSETSPISLNNQRIYWVDQAKMPLFASCRSNT